MSDWLTSRSEFDAVTETGNCVILFTAPAWCRPCQQMEPHFVRTSDYFKENNLPVKFFRVDVDTNEWAVLDFGIRGVPVCYLYVDGAHERNLKVPQNAMPFIANIRDELGV